MESDHNVGRLDGGIRIALGILCIGALGYHFLVAPLFPVYGMIVVVILILFFLKTGITRVCPLMKAFKISTM